MESKYNHNIEDWWRHNGIADRIQASGICCLTDDISYYFQKTDDWWDSLTDDEKKDVYEEFFSEV